MPNQRKSKNLLLTLILNLISLILVNFNLQAQLTSEIKTNNLQTQIDKLQYQIDQLSQNNNLAPENLKVRKKFKYLADHKLDVQATEAPVTFTSQLFTENFTVDLFTNLQVDYFLGHALELFNCNSYDDYMFTQGALDLGIDIAKVAGPRHHELFFDIRAKGVFGNSGIFNGTIPRPIKIGLGRTENSYSFQPALQNLWLRELWFKYNLDPTYHTDLQIGLFPYAIGSGLVLGNGYKVGKIIPGFYEERFVDQFRPGIMLSGDIWPACLSYKVYAGLNANYSSNFYDTAQFTYAQSPFWREHPERGSFFNNTIGALEIEYHSESDQHQTAVRPYLIINQDNFQQVEFPGDASSTLGILGLNIETQSNCWSFFLESAFNFGSQHVQFWDRDFIEFISKPTHMHLFQNFPVSPPLLPPPCWKQATTSPCPEKLSYQKYNGQEFTDCNDTEYKNSFDRYRKDYKNSYRGVMFYTEAAYRHLHSNTLGTQTTLALAAGYASGAENPNDSFEKIMANRLYGTCTGTGDYSGPCSGITTMQDYSKKYKGFVGVDQMFINRDVYSVFMLEAQKLNRPLATGESRLTYPLFSNLAFIGLGAKYDQTVDLERAFTLRFNLLTYWQAHATKKGYNYGLDILFALGSCGQAATDCFVPQLIADANKCLSQHLGSELNFALNYQFDQNLNFYSSFAAFFPGDYYRDAAGKIIPLEVQYQLASVDYSGYEMNRQKYDIGLGDSTALIFNIGFGYTFDTAPKQKAVFSPAFKNDLKMLDCNPTTKVTTTKLIDVNPQVTIITPTPTKRIAIPDLELLEILEYQAPPPTITPSRLTITSHHTSLVIPIITTPKSQLLPNLNIPEYQASVTKSTTLTTSACPKESTFNLPIVNPQDLKIKANVTNGTIINSIDPNLLTAELNYPESSVKLQSRSAKPVIFTTVPNLQLCTANYQAPKLNHLVVLQITPTRLAVTAQPSSIIIPNPIIQNSTITTSKTQKLSKSKIFKNQISINKPVTLTTSACPQVITFDLPTINPQELEFPKPVTKRLKKKVATAINVNLDPSLLTYESNYPVQPTRLQFTPTEPAVIITTVPNLQLHTANYQTPKLDFLSSQLSPAAKPYLTITHQQAPIITPTISVLKTQRSPSVKTFTHQIPVATPSPKLILTTNTCAQVITFDLPTVNPQELEFKKKATTTISVSLDPSLLTYESNYPVQPTRLQFTPIESTAITAIVPNLQLHTASYQTPKLDFLNSQLSPAAQSRLTVTNQQIPIVTPAVFVLKTQKLPSVKTFTHQIPVTAPSPKLILTTNSCASISTFDLPTINPQDLVPANTAISIDPSVLTYELNYSVSATKLQFTPIKPIVTTTTVPNLQLHSVNYQNPKLDFLVAKTPTLQSAKLITQPQVQIITLPKTTVANMNLACTTINCQNPELAILKYQIPKFTKSQTLVCPTCTGSNLHLPEPNHTDIATEVTKLIALNIPKIIKLNNTKSPSTNLYSPKTERITATPVRTRKSRSDFDAPSLTQAELELIENYKKNFAI